MAHIASLLMLTAILPLSAGAGEIPAALRKQLEENEIPSCQVNYYIIGTTINPVNLILRPASKVVGLVKKAFDKKQKDDGNYAASDWFSMELIVQSRHQGVLKRASRATQVDAFSFGSNRFKAFKKKADDFAKEHGCLFAELNEVAGPA